MKTKFEWKLKKNQLMLTLLVGILLIVIAMPVKKTKTKDVPVEAGTENSYEDEYEEAVERKLEEVLREVGLGDRLKNFPAQLSGGEQQRVSIARALAKNPKLLLCDEPTGALDYNTGKAILKLLQDTCREKGMTVILITHNSAIAPMADRVIQIKNGKVAKMTVNPHPVSVETIEW